MVILVHLFCKDFSVRIQDNYNLEKDDKWDMVYDILMNKIDSRRWFSSNEYL